LTRFQPAARIAPGDDAIVSARGRARFPRGEPGAAGRVTRRPGAVVGDE
jgi:hypothetical protein